MVERKSSGARCSDSLLASLDKLPNLLVILFPHLQTRDKALLYLYQQI